MNDLAAIGLFGFCVACTFGLLGVCGWLRPHEASRDASVAGERSKEGR